MVQRSVLAFSDTTHRICCVFLALLYTLANGLEIVEPPSDKTVFLDHTAVFTCETRGALYGYWRVNGTAYNNLPPALRDDLDADLETVGGNNVFTLTIPGRAEYNETVVQCVVGDAGGGAIESANATLMIQGLLSSVSDLRAEGSSFSITISWSAPFSLHPDIWYSVLISNVTDEDHPTAVPCTDCHNLIQTHYTFSPHLPSPCHKYTFTVIPQNGVGQGDSSHPVVGYTAPMPVDGSSVTTDGSELTSTQGLGIGVVVGAVAMILLATVTLALFLVIRKIRHCGSSRQDPATVPNAAYELHSTRSAVSMEMNIAYDHHTPTATRPPLYEVVQ